MSSLTPCPKASDVDRGRLSNRPLLVLWDGAPVLSYHFAEAVFGGQVR